MSTPSRSLTLEQTLELARGIKAIMPEYPDVRLVVQEDKMVYRGPEDPWTLNTCGDKTALTRANADTVSLAEVKNGLARLVTALENLVAAAAKRE